MGELFSKITQLGFSETNGLLLFENRERWEFLSPRVKHIISTIKPFAFYCIDHKPFILFFEAPATPEDEKKIHRQIWNSQIPIIIIETATSVKIFNGYLFDQEKSILKLLTDSKSLDKFSFWNIVSGETWIEFESEFKKKRLDEYLLENIQSVTEKLSKSIPRALATLLVLRLIFVRYLIDRGVNLNFSAISTDKEQAKADLNKIVGSKNIIYQLFAHLQSSFNGNLFDLYADSNTGVAEQDIITDENLRALQLFIGGSNVATEQLVLFDVYDFNIIPVELISNIYERFLGNQQRKKDGAFYTPSFLVDYILKHTIEPYLVENTSCRVLDPACGSGIFLVETLRRIIERNLSDRQYVESDKELSSYLVDNIFGIDKNEEAINVAIFSLYITLLDYKNPKQLKGFGFPTLKGGNFIAADFFNIPVIDSKLHNKKFQFIVGNPPWGSQPGDKYDQTNYHAQFVKKTNKECGENLISDFQIAQSFFIRAKDFASPETQCGLILTSKLLYNKGAFEFRNIFLTKECSIYRVLELSPVRFHLFKNAIAPSAIVLYSYNPPGEGHSFIHQSLKPNIFLRYFQIIVSEKYDIKIISQKLIRNNDWLWKVLVYGNVLDYYFIKNYLSNRDRFIPLDDYINTNDLDFGAGYKVGKKDRTRSIAEIANLPVVKGEDFQPLYINKRNLHAFTEEYPENEKINGIGKLAVYKAPHILIKRGAKNLPVVAYSDFNCCFPNTVYGITAKTHSGLNIDKLKAIGTILSSNIVSYFNFSLSPQWGIERDEVYLQDYRMIPFPNLDNNDCSELSKIFTERMNRISDYFSQTLYPVEEVKMDFDEEVSKFYNINEQECDIIDYNRAVSIPLFRNEISPYLRLVREGFMPYIKIFIEHFEDIFNEDGRYFTVDIYPCIANSHFAAIEFTIVNEKPINIIQYPKACSDSIAIAAKFAITKHTQYFFEQKDVINFEKDSFYIIKPNEFKNWHPAIAHLDLGEILEAFLDKND